MQDSKGSTAFSCFHRGVLNGALDLMPCLILAKVAHLAMVCLVHLLEPEVLKSTVHVEESQDQHEG